MSAYRLARGAVVVLALVALAALSWRANLLGLRTDGPFGSVATAFEPTPAHPGYEWTRGWPPGTVAPDASRSRQYVRDSRGVVYGNFRNLLERDVKLPSDARSTGYRLGAIELFVSQPDDERWIYVVGPSSVERWPRSDPMTLCI